MATWRPQHYQRFGRDIGVHSDILRHALEIGTRLIEVNPNLPPIFTLRHLAHISDIDYGFLRSIVSRSVDDPYRVFHIRKSMLDPVNKSYRIICVPDPALMRVQRWITYQILTHARPHHASFAYAKDRSMRHAAEVHCGCRWLIKLDVRRFFESLSEISVYRAFRRLGYQPLVSFELARLCTRLGPSTLARCHGQWLTNWRYLYVINTYQNRRLGHLPQGAPTSPMLSNLALIDFDKKIYELVKAYDLVYTRYADDLCFSSRQHKFSRECAAKAIGKIYATMAEFGLSPNLTKTRLVPPGGRKIVLGLLVDGNTPRLTREFRARLRQHIHYLCHPDIGPVRHAAARGSHRCLD